MSSETWEKAVEKRDRGWVGTLLQILTLGIAGAVDYWEVEYRNRQNGKVVRGTGTTEAEADARARAQCS